MKSIIERAKEVIVEAYRAYTGCELLDSISCEIVDRLTAANLLNDPPATLSAEEAREIAAKAVAWSTAAANAIRQANKSFGSSVAVEALVGHIQRGGLTEEQERDLKRWKYVSQLPWENCMDQNGRRRDVAVPISSTMGGDFVFALDAYIAESEKPKPISKIDAQQALAGDNYDIVKRYIAERETS